MASQTFLVAFPAEMLQDVELYKTIECSYGDGHSVRQGFTRDVFSNGEVEIELNIWNGEEVPDGFKFVRSNFYEVVTAFDPYSLPRVFVGKASYLKAGLLEDAESYVPATILRILDLIGDYTIITEDFIAAVEEAFSLDNTSAYSLGNEQEVLMFLFEHLGEYVMVA